MSVRQGAIMVENLRDTNLVQIRVAVPKASPFTQEEWNAYQDAVYQLIIFGDPSTANEPKINADIHVFNLPPAVLTIVGLPSGLNARMPETEAHRLVGMLITCAHAYAEDEAENKGKGK